MWTQAEISQQIRDTLLTYDPDISLDVGTPERKIVDAVAAVLATVQVDKFVTSYSNDINSKFGTDLDDFVSMFGMSRQASRSASGYITFFSPTPAQAPVLIPAGTIVSVPASTTQSEIIFVTKNDVVISINTSNVEAIVEAITPGTIGNVAAGAITTIVNGGNTALTNATQVTNFTPTSGGVDQETDAQLKVRFQNTIFRNIAGTLDQFLGLSLANTNVTKATVIGPVSTYTEYAQIGPTGYITSTNTSAKYIYNTNYYVNSDGTDTAIFYTAGSATGGSVIVGGDYFWINGGTSIANGNVSAQLRFNAVINPSPTGVSYAGSVLSVASSVGYLTGNYLWAYSYVYNPGGESTIGSAFPVDPITNAAAATAILSASANLYVPTAPSNGTSLVGGGVVARNIYRSADGGNTWGLVGSIFDNTTTVFSDNNPVPTSFPPNKGLSSASVVYLNYQYLSQNSRNIINDANGTSITNKIDIYTVGTESQNSSDIVTGPGIQFVSDPTSKYYYKNYTRGYSTANPSTANSFVQLTWTPVVTIPDQIVINGVTYSQGVAIDPSKNTPGTTGDYWLVKDATNLRDSVQSREGIEIGSAMVAAIGASIFPVNYTFNDVPLLTQEIIDQHKQLGQDVLVHLARNRYFRMNFVAIYDNGFSKSAVDQAVSTYLTNWFISNQTFGNIIEPGNILQQVGNVSGINTVKFATSSDNAQYYGIQEVDEYGNFIAQIYPSPTLSGNGAIDLEDIEIAFLYDLGPGGPIQKSFNNWTN
jgi:hypothetical protein